MLRAPSGAAMARRSVVSPVATRAIKLYTNPGSRGKMTEWYLAELGLQYETVNLNMRAGEHKTPAYLAINPFGKVPALQDGDLPLFESGAILLHLANKYGKLSADELGRAAQWTLFANSTFSEAFFVKGPTQSSAGLMQTLNQLLGKSTFITGDQFGAADVALGGYLLYLPMFFPDYEVAGPYPNVWRYMKDVAARPSCPAPYRQAMDEAVARVEKKGGNLLNKIFK
eukprot:CAMPEP_0202865376 /NCGR_PEP_ID=MMETSP1391-20130828/5859_1 /ASSEMBLY_ACC=CAM_ASM_000867 /TAXON_ID=1034604 /ORGANISM="Chlamydomonas leiostraca, Strain SAG 11-49" /LENGTH=226 /DNA_ID=CAMNT_0049545215 /DNA_START=133 /DNA_END=813 /DNA_ORIENTATION=+